MEAMLTYIRNNAQTSTQVRNCLTNISPKITINWINFSTIFEEKSFESILLNSFITMDGRGEGSPRNILHWINCAMCNVLSFYHNNWNSVSTLNAFLNVVTDNINFGCFFIDGRTIWAPTFRVMDRSWRNDCFEFNFQPHLSSNSIFIIIKWQNIWLGLFVRKKLQTDYIRWFVSLAVSLSTNE